MDFKGKFIVLDGPDGCGKSSAAEMLRNWISAQGTEAVSFRDPGTTKIGEKIRDILLDNANRQMDSVTELLLYMASRVQLWKECISPAIKADKCVVMDRWLSSTCAYQGYAGKVGVETVIKTAQISLERLWPDVMIILDIDLATAKTRLQPKLDRMEQKGDEYHSMVRQGFLKLAETVANIDVIDASRDIKTVHKDIISLVTKRIRNEK